MRYLIVRTEVRTFGPDEVNAAWHGGGTLRDESEYPEMRRQTAEADSLDAALRLARALASVGAVRSGRQRVKVLRIGQPRLLS
jgi:hypothetical protein